MDGLSPDLRPAALSDAARRVLDALPPDGERRTIRWVAITATMPTPHALTGARQPRDRRARRGHGCAGRRANRQHWRQVVATAERIRAEEHGG